MIAVSAAQSMLSESVPGRVAAATEKLAAAAIAGIEASLPRALAGETAQVREYVDAYTVLADEVLGAIDAVQPDFVFRDPTGKVVAVAEVKTVKATLAQDAMTAPFSEWVAALGPGRGTAVAVVAHLRRILPGIEPLPPPRQHALPDWGLDEGHQVGFYRAVLDELSRTDMPLERVASILDVTQTELAGLFGVRRQAVEQWAQRGVPSDRQEKLATLGEISDLLSTKLQRDRIAGVVRRAAPAYGGRSMLQAIANGEERHVLAELRDAFDWASAA